MIWPKRIGSFEQSKRIEVTDIKKLLFEDLSYLPAEIMGAYNIMGPYGIAYQLKKFAGIDTNVLLNKCSFEHGPYFYKMVCQVEVTHHASHILTYSPFREDVIRELTHITPIAIGPYIAYAEEYRAKKYVEEVKRKIGHSLLVMPSHSSQKGRIGYDIDEFIQQIEDTKKFFDTVIVCIHYEDLKLGLWKPYKEKGYYIVSAGNILSPYFLSRTKYIFYLADAFLANTVTTGMAFAMHMNYPIKLMKQRIKGNLSGRESFYELEVENLTDRAYALFDNDNFTISKEQIEFGNYVFGLDKVMLKREMNKLLKSLTRINE